MRILRLSHSGDTHPGVPEAKRSFSLTAQAIEAATGEPVETTCRVVWPRREVPDLVDSWIERYRPDIVIFWLNCYWFTYLNIPEYGRSTPRVLKAVGRLAKRVHLKKAVVSRAATLRLRVLDSQVRGRESFEPRQVIALSEAVIRRVLQHEEVSLIVRGSEWSSPVHSPAVATTAIPARAEGRRLAVHREVGGLCERLHVPYFGVEDGLQYARDGLLCPDSIHPSARTHANMAAQETAAILDIWRASGAGRAATARNRG